MRGFEGRVVFGGRKLGIRIRELGGKGDCKTEVPGLLGALQILTGVAFIFSTSPKSH